MLLVKLALNLLFLDRGKETRVFSSESFIVKCHFFLELKSIELLSLSLFFLFLLLIIAMTINIGNNIDFYWYQYSWTLAAWLICNSWNPQVFRLRILHVIVEIRIASKNIFSISVFLDPLLVKLIWLIEINYFHSIPGNIHKRLWIFICIPISLWLTFISASFELQEFKNSMTTF